MRNDRRDRFPLIAWLRALLIAIFALASNGAAAETASLEELVASVVRIKTQINPDGETVRGLGRERDGSGIIIDNDGLVLTIGYLMVEAYAAEVITNDGRTVPANGRRLRPPRPASACCGPSNRSSSSRSRSANPPT